MATIPEDWQLTGFAMHGWTFWNLIEQDKGGRGKKAPWALKVEPSRWGGLQWLQRLSTDIWLVALGPLVGGFLCSAERPKHNHSGWTTLAFSANITMLGKDRLQTHSKPKYKNIQFPQESQLRPVVKKARTGQKMQRYTTFLKCTIWEYPSILVESTTKEIWALKENTKYQLLQYLVPSSTTKILFTEIESYMNLILPSPLCSLFSFFLLSQIALKVQKWYFPPFSIILLSDCEGIKRYIGQKFSFNYRNTSLLRFHLSYPHSQKIWVNHKWIQADRLYF